jgi:hypothetical protein
MFDVFYFESGPKPNLFAHERAVDSIQHAQQLSRTRYFWVVNYLADYSDWDWLYEPVPWQAHHMHVWPSQHHSYSGTYLVPKQPTDEINFHTQIIPNQSVRHNWKILHSIEEHIWDWTWAPHPLDPPYIYVWGNQHWSAEQMPTVEYHVSGATEHKYMDIPAQLLPNSANWTTIDCADTRSIDFSWVPDPGEPPYIYVWGNQWHPAEIMPTATYCVPGATERKYMSDQVPLLPSKQHWNILEEIDHSKWDWTWVPSPLDPPYIYVWGNQWNPAEFKASLEYHVPGATESKYMDGRTQRRPNYGNQWCVLTSIEEFDYSWEPNPFDPAYIYVFGNQWYSAEIDPTVEYHVPGATERKYVHDIVARVQPNTNHYYQYCAVESFDYSWHPDPGEPAYIYVFGNQWHAAEIMPTVEYRVPGATERKYMSAPCAQLAERHTNHWHTIEECDWDYSWVPDPGDPPYIYVFGNQWHSAEIMPTVTYTVPGATERKYMDMPRAVLLQDPNRPWYNVVPDCDWDYSWVPDPGEPPYVYVFGNQHWPAEKMPTIEYRVTGATERKYMSYPCAELLPDVTHWTIPPGVDTKSVDLSWVPDPGEPPYIYQFATQHQKTGGPVYTVPGATETKYLEHVQVPIQYTTVSVVEINHLDGSVGQIPNTIKTIRYFDNYRDTLIRLAKSLVGEHEWVWVCSSICDYTGFDFSWHPERWQTTMLHVFASNEQKFGDTFYMHVPTFAERAEKKALLEWYSVNYVPRISVPRRAMPVIEHTADSHVDAVKNTDWAGPVALFTTNGMPITVPAVPLWRQETKTIVPLSSGASAVVVPRVAKGSIDTQLYDYPYIDKTQRKRHGDELLDIVFISNGEPNSASNYLQMQMYLANSSRTNRVHMVSGVKGRVAAYHAAARASRTPWFFAVFAKLEVDAKFDWTWQPDRMQQPKHYIFHAINPVNGLQYGHQAMIAYNQELVLNNPGLGLDFTLDSAHEVVPINSGTAQYNATPWMTWRTAFREVIKLCSSSDVESQYRLTQWLATPRTNVENWSWSVWGAEDAVEYYQAVKGEPTELRKSYEWAWLASYAFVKRSLTPDQ